MTAGGFPHGETWTVLRKGAADRHGDATYSEHSTMTGVAFSPQGPAGQHPQLEPNEADKMGHRRNTTHQEGTIYLPGIAEVDVTATDRMRRELDGSVWRVYGFNALYRNPWTGFHGIVIRLRRTEG